MGSQWRRAKKKNSSQQQHHYYYYFHYCNSSSIDIPPTYAEVVKRNDDAEQPIYFKSRSN